MSNTYCTATNTGIGFFTRQDRDAFHLSGHPGDVWVVGNNKEGVAWIDRVGGMAKTKAEAQAIVDAVIDGYQAEYDALTQEQRDLSDAFRGPPVGDTLN
jgi:hypothetical protein